MKGLIIHSSLARQDPYLGISMAFSTEDNAEGEKRVFAQTSSDLNPGGYRALFSLDRRPPLDTRGNREITPSKQCTQGLREERFKVISPLIRSEIPTLDPAVPDFSTDHSIPSRVEWLLARLVGGGIAGRRSFHC